MPPRWNPASDTWPAEARMQEERLASNLNHSEAKRRLLEKRNAELERRVAQSEVREPLTYGRTDHDGHGESYFYDQLRVATGRSYNMKATHARLAAHEAEMRVEMPRWLERRKRAAEHAYEAAMTRTPAETRALDRMETLGLRRFAESRAISRTDGQGGYVGVPPIWLLENWVSAPRAGRPFGDLWPTLALPGGTDNINIPRLTTGIGSGPQQGDLAPAPNRDPVDSFVNCRVVTIAGRADASMQFCEQTAPPGADKFVFGDMMADIDGNEDGQLILGNGFPLLNGAWPGAAPAAASMVYCANTNNGNTSVQTWVNGGTAATFNQTGNVYSSVARMLSVMNRGRGLPPTHVILAPWLWWSLVSTTDNSGRPLVQPAHTPSADTMPGVAGTAWSLPCVLDDNVPVTWGGTTAPSMSPVSQSVASPLAGSGSYTPVLAVRADDLLLFEGDVTTQILREVVAGTGQWRFQAFRYAASTATRYTAAATISASTSNDATSVTAGGSTIVGATIQNQANGILSLASWGG